MATLRGNIFRAISIVVVAIVVGIGALFLYVYKESVGRFQLRRLSLPTRIFADFTPLKPGVPLAADDVLEKLDRLGYRQNSVLAQPGDYMAKGGTIDIYTRDFKHPSGSYPAQPVRVTFDRQGARFVIRLPV